MVDIEELCTMLKGTMNNMVEVEVEDEEGRKKKTVYLGSYMSLDPCGRYHHVLSPNGVTDECIEFWEALNSAAEKLGGCIESGEGDATDVFFSIEIYDNMSS